MKECGIAIMVREQVKLQDKTISQVAREMNMSRNTVKKYLKEGEQEDRRKGTKRASKLDPYKSEIEEFLSLGIYNAVVIYERILEKGFDGKISILKDYLKPLRPVTIKEGPAVRRYETKAGSQVQMDWGICKYLDPHNRVRKVACFVMVLGFSRVRYIEFCNRCDLSSLQRCCVNAFEYFGGVPEVLLTDHLKDYQSSGTAGGTETKQQLKDVKKNADANRIANEYGFEKAEDFKAEIVGRSNVSKIT